MLLHKGLINLELVEKIFSWHHTGFNVHSKVRATTKREAERVGKYMIRPLLIHIPSPDFFVFDYKVSL